MAYTFDVVGWKGYNQRDHYVGPGGNLPHPRYVYGVWVHYYDPENEEDGGMFWSYALRGSFQTWAEWYVYISGLLVMHGKALADEG